MTSRLTLSALVFSLLSTAALVWSVESARPHVATRYVTLEKVVITAPRIVASN